VNTGPVWSVDCLASIGLVVKMEMQLSRWAERIGIGVAYAVCVIAFQPNCSSGHGARTRWPRIPPILASAIAPSR